MGRSLPDTTTPQTTAAEMSATRSDRGSATAEGGAPPAAELAAATSVRSRSTYVVPAVPRSASARVVELSLVVPTYDERETLPAIVARLDEALEARLGAAFEIIVVDDDSPDGTAEVARSLAHEHPRLRVVNRHGGRGLGTAVACGWSVSTGAVLGVIDADLQHPPSVILGLLDALDAGADLASASRFVDDGETSDDWSAARRLISLVARATTRIVVPEVPRLADPLSGCFAVRRDLVEGVALSPLGYKILLEVLVRCQPESVVEVGYHFSPRETGTSKATPLQYAQLIAHLAQLRRSRPPTGIAPRTTSLPVSDPASRAGREPGRPWSGTDIDPRHPGGNP